MKITKLQMLGLSAAMLVTVQVATAQTCTATSGRSAELLNVTGGAAFTPDSYTVSGRLGAAGQNAFGGARVVILTRDVDGRNAFAFGADFGWKIPLGIAKTVMLCPILDYSYQAGPNNNGPNQIIRLDSYHVLAPGMNIGRVVSINDNVAILPFAGGSMQWLRYERREFGDRDKVYTRFVTARAGFGVEFMRSWVIRTSIATPVGVPSPQTSVAIAATVSFRGPRTVYPGQQRK
ncbi:MAG: hypothetical protein ABI852_10150 [Gemmatimonadaceae bacterium]